MATPERSRFLAWRQVRVPAIAVGVAFALGLLASAAAYFLIDEGDRSQYWLEAGKAGMQTIVFAAIGAIVTAAIKSMEDQRATTQRQLEQKHEDFRRQEDVRRAERRRFDELRQAEMRRQEDIRRADARRRDDYRMELLRRLRAAYSAIKRVRRELEHAGFKPESSLPFTAAAGPVDQDAIAAYRAAMPQLREAKLDLEAMREELEAGVGLGGSTEQIKEYLSVIENYIDDKVIDEQRKIPAAALANLDLNQVSELQRFVASAHVAFRDHVSRPYHEASRVLVADILGTHSASKPLEGVQTR